MSKSALLREIATELPKILVANGFHTNLGAVVQYGITIPSWREVDELQWLDASDDYQGISKSLATVIVSAVGYGDRLSLLEKGIQIEEDLRKAFSCCCLGRGRVSITKEVKETGDDCAINVVAEVVLPWT